MSNNFTKQKLSREAIDNFALRYSDKKYPGCPNPIPYMMSNGEQIKFAASDAILRWKRGA